MHHVDQYCRQKLLCFLPDTDWKGADLRLSCYIYMDVFYSYSYHDQHRRRRSIVKLEFVLVLSVRPSYLIRSI